MAAAAIKRYLPRSLLGRAVLILLLPVITVQLVVTVVFVQRHFEGVTEQMTQTVSRELALLGQVAGAGDGAGLARLADALAYSVEEIAPGELTGQDRRRWYDFSGIVVIRVLRERLPGLVEIDLREERQARVVLEAGGRLWRLTFDRRRVSASNPHQLLVNMLLFGALVTAIAYVYLRNQIRPIIRLAAAASAFGKGRVVPFRPSGAAEVRTAGEAFLEMRERIERHIEQRTMMLSGVSHDLRTPLTRLRLGLSMLDGEEARELLRDVDEMERLLDAFLDFARGEGESDAARAVDVCELAEGVVERMRAGGADVRLVACAGPGGREITLRPLAMQRALENVIANAVRYAGRAEVSVELDRHAVRFIIEDDGPGIAPEDRERALRPFERLDPARNQDRGSGVGLGLAITADIIRAHGGTVRLGRSDRLGGLRVDLEIAR